MRILRVIGSLSWQGSRFHSMCIISRWRHSPSWWPSPAGHWTAKTTEERIQINWQWPLSGVQSIMMINSAQPGEGGPCTLSTITRKLWCTLQLRGQIQSSYFSSTLFFSVAKTFNYGAESKWEDQFVYKGTTVKSWIILQNGDPNNLPNSGSCKMHVIAIFGCK